jgi:alginate O-acetyltransferase complex protein AlgJ
MLKLPASSKLYPPQPVTVQPVWNGTAPFKPDSAAQILVLGDSFSNIYSLEAMGWGASAGFVEQLGYHLRQPVDAILRNDAGAFATRELLAKELAQGRDRLAGKKILVWEFAMRELGVGNWKMIPLTLGEKHEVGLYVPAAGKTVSVRGGVRAASPSPRPGSVPYKDHIVMVHLAELASPDDPAAAGREAVVFMWSMQDNKPTPAASFRPGDTVQLQLRPWADVTSKYEAINRSELDDEKLLLAEPNWGEPPK